MNGKITLRAVTSDDVRVFYAHQSDPVARQVAGFPTRTWDAHAAHWSRLLADDTIVARTIVVDGHVAGNIVSFLQDGCREVGYWLGREFWGRGIATGALAAFLDDERRRPLQACVATHNVASRRVLEKCGFVLVRETDRDAWFERNA